LQARAAEVLGVAFLARERGVVVSISCGIKQCPEMAMLTRLGKLVESHLPELDVVQDESTGVQGIEGIGTPPIPQAPAPATPSPGGDAPAAPGPDSSTPATPTPSPGPRQDPLP
jgi:hypothetical protein